MENLEIDYNLLGVARHMTLSHPQASRWAIENLVPPLQEDLTDVDNEAMTQIKADDLTFCMRLFQKQMKCAASKFTVSFLKLKLCIGGSKHKVNDSK